MALFVSGMRRASSGDTAMLGSPAAGAGGGVVNASRTLKGTAGAWLRCASARTTGCFAQSVGTNTEERRSEVIAAKERVCYAPTGWYRWWIDFPHDSIVRLGCLAGREACPGSSYGSSPRS